MEWTQLAWTSAFVSCKSMPQRESYHIVHISLIVLLLVTITFLPESPVWLASKNKLVEAQHARDWLKLEKYGSNTKTENGESQHASINTDDESQSWKVLFTRPILMPMLIGLTLLLIQQVSGIDAVIFFTVDIFRSSGNLFVNSFYICAHKTVNTFTLHDISICRQFN